MELNFIYKNNFIFNANALVKFLIIINYLVIILLFNNPIYMITIFLNLLIISLFATSTKKCFKFVKYMGVIAFFIFILNILLNNNGSTIIFTIYTGIPFFTYILITLETLLYSIITIFQLFLIMYMFALMNIIINPDDLMKCFIKLKMPYVMTLLMTLSLRFFPLLTKDLEEISDVQRSRGFELDKGNWITRINNKMVLLLPLLTNSLERSIQVSEALESRAFGISKKNVFFNEISFKKIDYFIIIINIFILFWMIVSAVMKFGLFDIYPTISILSFSVMDNIILSVFFFGNLLMILLIKLGDRKK